MSLIEALMLTVLIPSRLDLADEPKAAADEVFGLALTLCPPDHLVTKQWWKVLMHNKLMGDAKLRARKLLFEASSIREKNENKRVTSIPGMEICCLMSIH